MPVQNEDVSGPQDRIAALLRSHGQPSAWFFRHPIVTARILFLIPQLPVITHTSGRDDIEGQLVSRCVPRSRWARVTGIRQLRHVLTLPLNGIPYNAGPTRSTQRRKARLATRLGVTSRLISDDTERLNLLDCADEFNLTHPMASYRTARPEDRDVLDVDLWMAAFHEGSPIMLVVVPIDGQFAALRYFRVMAQGTAASSARYLMTEHLAEELTRRDVRYLFDHVNPARLRPGLFHFAQMVGFRVVRVQAGPRATSLDGKQRPLTSAQPGG